MQTVLVYIGRLGGQACKRQAAQGQRDRDLAVHLLDHRRKSFPSPQQQQPTRTNTPKHTRHTHTRHAHRTLTHIHTHAHTHTHMRMRISLGRRLRDVGTVCVRQQVCAAVRGPRLGHRALDRRRGWHRCVWPRHACGLHTSPCPVTRGRTRGPTATLTFCTLPFRTNTRRCWGLGGLAALLRNPQPFIEQAVATAVKEGYTGYNFDNELRGGASFPWFAFLVHTPAPTPTRCSCPTAAPRALHQAAPWSRHHLQSTVATVPRHLHSRFPPSLPPVPPRQRRAHACNGVCHPHRATSATNQPRRAMNETTNQARQTSRGLR